MFAYAYAFADPERDRDTNALCFGQLHASVSIPEWEPANEYRSAGSIAGKTSVNEAAA